MLTETGPGERGARTGGRGRAVMIVVRAVAVGVLLMDLALLTVVGPLRTTVRRYALGERQREIRALRQENLELLHRVALARRPEEVIRRAAALGIRLQTVDGERLDPAGGGPAAGRSPLARVPRR